MWLWMCNFWKIRMYMFGFVVVFLGGIVVVNVVCGLWLGGNIGCGIGFYLDWKLRFVVGMNCCRGSFLSVMFSM